MRSPPSRRKESISREKNETLKIGLEKCTGAPAPTAASPTAVSESVEDRQRNETYRRYECSDARAAFLLVGRLLG